MVYGGKVKMTNEEYKELSVKEHKEWMRKYKRKFIYAWKNCLSDEEACRKIGISETELQLHLTYDASFEAIRAKYVDELLGISRGILRQALYDGNIQVAEWYSKNFDPRLNKPQNEISIEDTYEDKREKIEDFMDKFKAKPGQFDE